jgi:uncharacterized protein (TIGR04255 family)
VPPVATRLDKDPIVEATFECRFQGTIPAVADVLQGAIYANIRDRFPKVARHPLADFTSALVDNPALRYQPRLILEGTDAAIFIGDRSIAVASPKPYMGWRRFRALILEVLQLVREANVVRETERISLRYINLLAAESVQAQFSLVHYTATLGAEGKYKLNTQLTYTRTEIAKEGIVSIVELAANSVITTKRQEQLKGMVVTVDTIYPAPKDFLDNPTPHLEKAHTTEKAIFFDLLTQPTLDSMGPHYD